jgi:hypothetical protein
MPMNLRGKFLLAALVAIAGLTGCAWLTQPPRAGDARQHESTQRTLEREAAVDERARHYERQGLDRREARAAAEVEYTKSGR